MKIKNCRKNNAITLIALVITIVILLILAVVGINFLFGDNGLINYAQHAGEVYSESEVKEKIEFLLGQYVIDKNINQDENADLEKYIRKHLQVGVKNNEDGTYSFNLEEWQVLINENSVISIEKFKLDVYKIFSNVESMKSDLELTAGKIVKTESYWEEKYEGGAYYDIVSTTNMTVDNATCIQLNNGLYAELHVINDTVTVNQFGAYGDGEHDDSDAINNAINSNYKNIKFESETYKINKRIDIQSSDTVLLGNGATITFDDNFTFNDDFIIGIFNYEEIVKNIEIQNLAIINNNTTYANEYFMLKIIRSRKC